MSNNQHITPELFTFLRDLKKNNNREWFQAHKQRYESQVREPLLNFISDFGLRLPEISRHFVADARKSGGSLFRINRDVRFAKDKSPYKTNAGLQFRHERGKDVHAPGFYLHLEPDGVFIGGVSGILTIKPWVKSAMRLWLDRKVGNKSKMMKRLRHFIP